MLSPVPTMEPRVLLYRPSFFSLFFLSPSLYCHVLVIPLLDIIPSSWYNVTFFVCVHAFYTFLVTCALIVCYCIFGYSRFIE